MQQFRAGVVDGLFHRIDDLERRIAALEEQSIQTPASVAEEVIRAVCETYDVTRVQLLSPRRDHRVGLPRQVGCWLCHRVLCLTQAETARVFRRHVSSTIAHACQTVDNLMDTDPVEAARIRALQKRFIDFGASPAPQRSSV
jgi:chromosomal replication initiation ATPase DnaA